MKPLRPTARRLRPVYTLLIAFLVIPVTAHARNTSHSSPQPRPHIDIASPVSLDADTGVRGLRASVAQGTTWLGSFTFDQGGTCIDDGRTSVDLTAQIGNFWHVDDFAAMGPNFHGHTGVLSGSKSLWCGAWDSEPGHDATTYPFNPVTTVEFTVKEFARVTVAVYNVRGQLVKTLVDDRFAPGITHTVRWDGRNNAGQQVSSGVYFYRLVTNDFVATRKMVLLK